MSEQELNNIKINMAELKGSLNLITEVLSRVEAKIDTHTEKEENFMNRADTIYASKTTVDRIVAAIITLIVGLVASAIYTTMDHISK